MEDNFSEKLPFSLTENCPQIVHKTRLSAELFFLTLKTNRRGHLQHYLYEV